MMETTIREEFDAIEARISRLENSAESQKKSPFYKFWSDHLFSAAGPPSLAHETTWNGALEAAIRELLLNSKDKERLRAMKAWG